MACVFYRYRNFVCIYYIFLYIYINWYIYINIQKMEITTVIIIYYYTWLIFTSLPSKDLWCLHIYIFWKIIFKIYCVRKSCMYRFFCCFQLYFITLKQNGGENRKLIENATSCLLYRVNREGKCWSHYQYHFRLTFEHEGFMNQKMDQKAWLMQVRGKERYTIIAWKEKELPDF